MTKNDPPAFESDDDAGYEGPDVERSVEDEPFIDPPETAISTTARTRT